MRNIKPLYQVVLGEHFENHFYFKAKNGALKCLSFKHLLSQKLLYPEPLLLSM